MEKYKYVYCEHWCREDKEATNIFTLEESKVKITNSETVFVICYKNNENNPFAIIMISENSFYLSYLNKKLDEINTYKYQVVDDSNRLLLVMFHFWEYNYSLKINPPLNLYCNKASVIYFASIEDEGWLIKDKPILDEVDNITEIESQCELKNKIDESSLWEEIPKFGKWDYFLRDDKDRIKFLKVNN